MRTKLSTLLRRVRAGRGAARPHPRRPMGARAGGRIALTDHVAGTLGTCGRAPRRVVRRVLDQAIALVVWLAWIQIVVAIAAEIAARLRGHSSDHRRGSAGPSRRRPARRGARRRRWAVRIGAPCDRRAGPVPGVDPGRGGRSSSRCALDDSTGRGRRASQPRGRAGGVAVVDRPRRARPSGGVADALGRQPGPRLRRAGLRRPEPDPAGLGPRRAAAGRAHPTTRALSRRRARTGRTHARRDGGPAGVVAEHAASGTGRAGDDAHHADHGGPGRRRRCSGCSGCSGRGGGRCAGLDRAGRTTRRHAPGHRQGRGRDDRLGAATVAAGQCPELDGGRSRARAGGRVIGAARGQRRPGHGPPGAGAAIAGGSAGPFGRRGPADRRASSRRRAGGRARSRCPPWMPRGLPAMATARGSSPRRSRSPISPTTLVRSLPRVRRLSASVGTATVTRCTSTSRPSGRSGSMPIRRASWRPRWP